SEAIQPDSLGRVLYLASQAAPDQFELFSAPVDAMAPPFRVNTALPFGPVVGDVLEMQLSPDGVHAVYRADQDEDDDIVDLFTVRLDRPGETQRLSVPLAPGETVTAFAITPDSRLVAYWVRDAVPAFSNFWVVPIEGGDSLPLGRFLKGPFLAFDPTNRFAVI